MGIGSKLNELMKKRGTNANELAQKIGVPPTTIYSMIKRDNKKADIDVLLKIARERGVSAEYFSEEVIPCIRTETADDAYGQWCRFMMSNTLNHNVFLNAVKLMLRF